MSTFKLSAALGSVLLLGGLTSIGCVADRPARNGVFNENQYVRKDFLIQGVDPNGTAAGTDPGWMVRSTVTETSTPNLLGDAIDIWGGASANINLVRFRVTSDKLEMLDQIQLSNPIAPHDTGTTGQVDTTSTTSTVLNAWAATNVDLKYRVNLDGETTNFYEENQELDWQVRQWVKLSFDKNDMSDLAPLGPAATAMLNKCSDIIDASATLLTDSFVIDPGQADTIYDDYMEFTVQVTLPMMFDDPTCVTAYGAMGLTASLVGRTNITVNLKYSFNRALPMTAAAGQPQVTYKPFVLAEKDPIRTKYGPILQTVYDRDPTSQLLAATQYVVRPDPAKPYVWYFEQGFPENYKCFFRSAADCTYKGNTIESTTNDVLTTASSSNPSLKTRVVFKEWNDGGIERHYGDIRYNFLRWAADQDIQDTAGAVTMTGVDPRTGENLNTNIEFFDENINDALVQRIDAFLASIGDGSSDMFPPGACTAGQALPIVDETVVLNHNANSTLFTKMQTYLGLHGPNPAEDYLGPQDFVAKQDADFEHAYFTLAPYEIFADPAVNPFVIPEGGAGSFAPPDVYPQLASETQFQQLAATLNSGAQPFAQADGSSGVANAAAFADQMRSATDNHMRLTPSRANASRTAMRFADPPGAFTLETVMEQDARQCVNGHYQTKAEWQQGLVDEYWQHVFWHEFGHAMGLDHNFMASVDKPNFPPKLDANGKQVVDPDGNPIYDYYASSLMEYTAAPVTGYWSQQGWAPFDKGNIAWIYANNGLAKPDAKKDAEIAAAKPLSGQADATYPYADPDGWNGANELKFLRCDATHLQYSPLCRQGDLGTTPSEIIANDIDNYEWQFQWRNFRQYHKIWDEANYANAVVATIVDMRRFLPQWYFDWSPGDLATVLHRIGIVPPVSQGAVSANDYYTQLTQKFLKEMSKANQMMAAFSEAIIQQASDERPYATVYDPFFGDETQQGIILDKFFAMQNFVGLWQADNYDPTQAAGTYLSSWGSFSSGEAGVPNDGSYASVAETTVTSMIGSQYAAFPYFIPTAVALFAQDTHNSAYLSSGSARVEAKDWIGGWVFSREDDLINFFKNIAVQNAFTPTVAPSGSDAICTTQLNSYVAAGVCGAGAGCEGLANCCAAIVDPVAAGNCNAIVSAATTPVPCSDVASCDYDITDPRQVTPDANDAHFTGPDGLVYIYSYIPSRANWILARQDRNVATYKLLTQYNSDLIITKDDGTNGTYSLEYQIKYTLDSYQAYEAADGAGNVSQTIGSGASATQ